MGATNRFNDKTNSTLNQLLGVYASVSEVARYYKDKEISSIVVAEENYGEGSSREHAAMEPRFLNVKVVLAKSFARIHAGRINAPANGKAGRNESTCLSVPL